jgi:hypothetical protein
MSLGVGAGWNREGSLCGAGSGVRNIEDRIRGPLKGTAVARGDWETMVGVEANITKRVHLKEMPGPVCGV